MDSKVDLKTSIRECISRTMNIDRVRRFERRAHDYMATYMELGEQGGAFAAIEKIRKRYRTHRCVEDFDRQFIRNA